MCYLNQEPNSINSMLWDLRRPCWTLLSSRSHLLPLFLLYSPMTWPACPSSNSLTWDGPPNCNSSKSTIHGIWPWTFLYFMGSRKKPFIRTIWALYHPILQLCFLFQHRFDFFQNDMQSPIHYYGNDILIGV